MSLLEPIPLRIWRFVVANKTYFISGAIGLILLLVLLYQGFCARPATVKIDEEAISKINSQNRAERIKELTEVVEDNTETIKTVDNRSTLSEINVVERNAEVDAKVRKADEAIEHAKRHGRDVKKEELECLLTGVCP